jgi:hypothetical protein
MGLLSEVFYLHGVDESEEKLSVSEVAGFCDLHFVTWYM